MGKLLCGPPSSTLPDPFHSLSPVPHLPSSAAVDWESVDGLDDQQRRSLSQLSSRGVLWKHPSDPSISATFRLFHGGDVQADGNCLFSAARIAMGLSLSKVSARDLRRRTVGRFEADLVSGVIARAGVDEAVRHLYSPDLRTGWGVHVVQEVKLLARKVEREELDAAISELVDLGLQRESAAESIYKERGIAVDDGPSWVKFMSVSGSADDEYDIITLQYTEDGLLAVDENTEGRAAAFGDDIAVESLATEFGREIFVVQAHGSDAMIEEDSCLFFLPHCPRGQISEPPAFLLMKGRGWCGAGADHYEPLISFPAPNTSQEKAAIVL
ncbi:uncharacterized protein LOC116258031 [Nymphaea colorata]|nr:uncharacterized protein LOC116258031 [Nymphaea colorata]